VKTKFLEVRTAIPKQTEKCRIVNISYNVNTGGLWTVGR